MIFLNMLLDKISQLTLPHGPHVSMQTALCLTGASPSLYLISGF